MRMWLGCALLASCGFQHGGSARPDGGKGGGSDASDATSGSCFGFGTQGPTGYYVCDPRGEPQGGLNLNTPAAAPFDSDTCSGGVSVPLLEQTVCLLDGTGVTIDSFVATGSAALVIASTSDLMINTLLDVSTQATDQHGAGYNPSPFCDPAFDPIGGTSSTTTGGGGGAGGSFASAGGNGGSGSGSGAGSGGTAIPLQFPPTTLRGGCPGGNGGSATGASAGTAGWGGGAVFVVALGAITINGTIDASGERGYGGSGTPSSGSGGGGGGGAGAGGMILLDSAMPFVINGTAKLIANGGGGGGGGDTGAGSGADGNNAVLATPQMQPGGGNGGGGHGGDGGSGAALMGSAVGGTTGSTAGSAGGGGGGGGGGSGVIMVVHGGTLPSNNNISPAAQPANTP